MLRPFSRVEYFVEVHGASVLRFCTFANFLQVFATLIFTVRRYASTVLAVVVCPSVRLSVRPLHAGTVSKRLSVSDAIFVYIKM